MLVLKVDQKETEKIILEAIKREKVIVCPTDTVYGLLADVYNKKAVGKIFKIKERKKKKSLPVFVNSLGMAKKLAKINKKQEKLLKSLWPGKVTVVLERKAGRKKLYGLDKRTIALRIPRYGLINNLNKKLNQPLVETSVNVSDRPPMIKIEEIINYFQKRKLQPDLIIDAGNLKKSKPSKVIDLTGITPKVLRK